VVPGSKFWFALPPDLMLYCLYVPKILQFHAYHTTNYATFSLGAAWLCGVVSMGVSVCSWSLKGVVFSGAVLFLMVTSTYKQGIVSIRKSGWRWLWIGPSKPVIRVPTLITGDTPTCLAQHMDRAIVKSETPLPLLHSTTAIQCQCGQFVHVSDTLQLSSSLLHHVLSTFMSCFILRPLSLPAQFFSRFMFYRWLVVVGQSLDRDEGVTMKRGAPVVAALRALRLFGHVWSFP
jgi:hypothetical protein